MLLHVNWIAFSFVLIFCLVNCLYAQDTLCNDTDVRLTGGRDEREGRVEVCIGEEWGTVCNNSWDVADAVVVCRQLGLGTEAPAVTQTFSVNDTTTGPTLLDNVTCIGMETTLTDCPHNGFGIHNCSHTQDAGVSCPASQPYLLFADGNFGIIFRSNLNGSGLEVLVPGLPGPIAIDYDYRQSSLFWTDIIAGRIATAGLDGSEVTTLVDSEVPFALGLSVDWINGKLYWTDGTLQHIEVYDISTRIRKVLIETGNSTRPQAIVVDPATRWLYWSDTGDVGKIERASMDGDARQVLHDTVLVSPTGLTLDYENQVLYWIDSNTIESSNVDGSDRRLIISLPFVNGFQLSFYDDVLYWTELNVNALFSITAAGSQISILIDGFSFGTGIEVVSENRQQLTGTNPCADNNGGCSHLCLLSAVNADGFTCTCPEDLILDADGQNCLATFCPSEGEIRLSGGTEKEGRVEICLNNTWGTLCSSSWNDTDASVVCQQLGYSGSFALAVDLGQGGGIVHVQDVACTGAESNLLQCVERKSGSGMNPPRLVDRACRMPAGAICEPPCRTAGFGRDSCLSCSNNADCFVASESCSCEDSCVVTGDCCRDSFVRRCSALRCNETDIRLVNGSTPTSGVLEVCFEGTMGFVCSDSWGRNDAAVACRQLGFPTTDAIPLMYAEFQLSIFGELANNSILFDEVQCRGDENSLIECQHEGIGSHECFSFAAGVICTGYFAECNDTDIRLVGGVESTNETFGRVEICFGGVWGTVCDDFWNDPDASVVCTQLGHPSEGDPDRALALAFATFGQGDGPIFLDNVICTGDESSLVQCQHPGIAIHNCDHTRDAGVVCPGPCSDGDIRLVDQISATSGRVEVCFQGIWGTVCDDFWDESDATVACRQLGFDDTGAVAVRFAQFGSGFGIIHLDDVQCNGSESRLADCSHRGVGIHDCTPSQDAGVICRSGPVERCNDTTNPAFPVTEGSYRFGGVCDAYQRGSMLCDSQLGESVEIYFSNALRSSSIRTQADLTSELNAIITQVFATTSVQCQELIQSVLCLYYYTPCSFNGTLTSPVSICPEECFYVQNECVNAWNQLETLLGTAASSIGFINCSNPGQILEPLSHCCADAGITIPSPVCNETDIRLVNGSIPTSGILEVCVGGRLGHICSNSWDSSDAAVACRQLGFPTTDAIPLSSAVIRTFGMNNIRFDEVQCSGDETSLIQCQRERTGCLPSFAAGVICTGYFAECNDTDIRLVGGVESMTETFGRLEICFGGTWGTVCDEFWDDVDASVVCTQIGLSSEGAIALFSATFGQGDGPLFLDNVACTGNESKLAECQHLGIASHNCTHTEDAAVVCPGACSNGEIRLVDQVSPTSGRVEVCFQGIWGSVCGDFWDENDAAVACRQLGLNDTGAVEVRFAQFGAGFGIIHLDDVQCNGSESRLADCSHRGVGIHDCTPSQDAGVICRSGPVERCNEITNAMFPVTEESYRFGGVCEPYQGGSIQCEGEIGEGADIYLSNARGVSKQEDLTSQLDNIISSVFETTSAQCKELIRNVLCLYYYTPCGFNGTLTPPVSICPEECFYVQNECAGEWNLFGRLLGTTVLGFINCSSPGQSLEPLPQCCVDAGITIPAPAGSPTATSTPVTISPGESSAPVAAGVTVALLLLLAVLAAVVIIAGLLWLKKRRRVKAANRAISLEMASWTRRNEHAIDENAANEPHYETSGVVGVAFQNPYTLAPNDEFRGRTLTPVTSRYMRELTGKMIIPSSRIRLMDTLGHGEFGIVYKAHLLPQVSSKTSSCPLPQTVAVKTLKGYFGKEDINNMMDESVKMNRFNHPNVINLIGVCVDAGPAPYIIMPFMANGSLLSYLKQHRPELMLPDTADEDDVSDVEKKLIVMCLQIAKGMEYLAEHKFVHRDLAARNCMIDLHHVIKVSDFGLTEDVYARNYFRQGQEGGIVKLPVKWMSPESLHDGVFTEKTDVWSFGITCWEIFSGGRAPYAGVDPLSLAQLLENGQRLDKPLNAACSDNMYDTMLKCWLVKADERPPFSELVVLVSKALERRAGYLDFSAIPSASFLSASIRRKGGKKSVVPLSPMSTPTASPSPSPTPTPISTPNPTPPPMAPPMIVVTEDI